MLGFGYYYRHNAAMLIDKPLLQTLYEEQASRLRVSDHETGSSNHCSAFLSHQFHEIEVRCIARGPHMH